ncbi:hypothetical protein Tco_0370359 [Tanacetum coccineum]
MVTSMGISHTKPYTLRGGPSMKLEQRSDSQSHVLHLHQGLPAKIEIVVIQGLQLTITSNQNYFDLIEAWSFPYLHNQWCHCGTATISPIQTKPKYFSEDYNEEREIEPRPEPTRAATPPLRIASPRIRRRGERIVGFEGTQSRGESRAKRNTEGGRPLEEAHRGNGG